MSDSGILALPRPLVAFKIDERPLAFAVLPDDQLYREHLLPDSHRSGGMHECHRLRSPAGRPILAVENFEGVLEIEWLLVGEEGLFALRVTGTSMRDAGIHEGDFVIVRHQPTIQSGEIGVAFKGDEATIKRIYKLRTGWNLEPANPDFQAEVVSWDDGDFRIGGKVVGVFRKL